MALRDLQAFKTPDQAFEKRGYSRGISLVLDALRSIYDVTHGGNNDSASNDAARQSTSGISADYDAGLGKPTEFSY